MKNLELTKMEDFSGGEVNPCYADLYGAGIGGAIAGGIIGGPAGFAAGWLGGAIGGFITCAIREA